GAAPLARAARAGGARMPFDGSTDDACSRWLLLPWSCLVVLSAPGHAATRSAARKRALLARGLAAISASVGVSDGRVTRRRRGVRPQTQTGSSRGQMEAC